MKQSGAVYTCAGPCYMFLAPFSAETFLCISLENEENVFEDQMKHIPEMQKKRWERETLGNGKMVGWIENAVKSTELVDRKTRAYQILFSIIFKPEWPILGLSEKEKKINSGLIIVDSLSSLSVSVMASDLVCCIRCFISREKKRDDWVRKHEKKNIL